MKNLFLIVSISSLGILAMSQGLNKSTLNQCTNNNSNLACEYLLTNGSNFEKNIAKKTLLIRGL